MNQAQERKLATDVVVVGAGFGGLSAALEARQQGAEVIVLSRTGLLANNSAVSGGQEVMIGTPLQREQGIEDSPELYVEDVIKANKGTVDVELIKVVANGATELYEWLSGFGAQFTRLVRWRGHSVRRVHSQTIAGGDSLVRMLHEAARRRNIDVRLGTAATSLTTDTAGGITGVKARDRQGQILEIQAHRGVVLAAGGFAKDKEMLRKYAPKAAGQPSCSAGGSTGDGIRMGMEVGAETACLDSATMIYGILDKTGRYTKKRMNQSVRLALGEGIAVNKEGRRFMDESTTYARGTSEIMRQTDRVCFAVFDEETKTKVESVESGEVFTAGSIEELAAELNIDPHALSETIARYSEAARNGDVPDIDAWGNPVSRHCLEGRLYAITVTPVTVMTHGGLRTNTSAEVIGRSGHPIPGLYAVGDNAPGLGGASNGYNACPGYLPGTGNTTALCFGRVAGRNAAGRT